MMNERYEKSSLWTRLKDAGKPVFMYGTGNGADRILEYFDRFGIGITGIFASDGFVRDRTFHGFRVRSYGDVTAEYGDDIIVVLAFGSSLPDVMEFIESLDRKHELIIPDIPLYGGELFDENYFETKKEPLEKTREILSDDMSREILDDTVNFRLTGKLRYASRTQPFVQSVEELLTGRKYRNILDGGAYRGDTADSLITALAPEKVWAVEPDIKTFAKLSAYAESENRASVIPLNAALAQNDSLLRFSSQGSRGSGKSGRGRRVEYTDIQAVTIDSIAPRDGFQLIKLDIEGLEMQALSGGISTIVKHDPDLIVSAYHRTDDIIDIPAKISELLPGHRLYLRRVPCLPMWDLNLFAVKA